MADSDAAWMGDGSKLARLVSGVAGGVGMVASGLENLSGISRQLADHFWIVLSVSWVLSAAALWPKSARIVAGFGGQNVASAHLLGPRLQRLRQFSWVVAATIAFVAVGAWRYYQQWHPIELPRNVPVIDPAEPIPVFPKTTHTGAGEQGAPSGRLSSSGQRFRDMMLVSDRPNQTLILVNFGLSEKKTSYAKAKRHGFDYYHLENFGRPPTQTFFFYGDCDRDRPSPKVLGALSEFAAQRKRLDLLQYLESYDLLVNLVRHRAQVLQDILPRGAEWGEITAESQREVILEWMRVCVGLVNPVFRLTLHNPTTSPVVLSAMTYYLLADEGEGSGEFLAKAVEPIASYAHGLHHMEHPGQMPRGRRPVLYSRHVEQIRRRIGVRWAWAFFQGGEQRFAESGRFNEPLLIPAPQSQALTPPLSVGPGGTVAFDVQIYPIRNRAAASFGTLAPILMSIEIKTTAGSLWVPEFYVDFSTRAG
jgi:hypothetical protein